MGLGIWRAVVHLHRRGMLFRPIMAEGVTLLAMQSSHFFGMKDVSSFLLKSRLLSCFVHFPFSTNFDQILFIISSANNDTGIHISHIQEALSGKGFSANDVQKAILDLSNEGHIYSTIDEMHFQYAS
jgi:hypothetical protein